MSEGKTINRRQALQNLGMMGVGAALASCVQPIASAQASEADVLNFALNLEYLEAEFYLKATTGEGLSAADAGGGPASTGGRKVTFETDAIRQFAEEIAADELAHVRFLRRALGSAAVARPPIDIGAAFAAAGSAASGGAITGFDPYANEAFFLHGAFVFEDVGVTAYKGAAPAIKTESTLAAAAGILAVEAYHAGEIRTLLYQIKDVTPPGLTLKVEAIVQAISNLRGSVGGGKDQGITVDGKANIVVADGDAIAFGRTTREVLNIVYLAAGATRGGFFPNGLNGTIK